MNERRTHPTLPPLLEREQIALLDPFESLATANIVVVSTLQEAERAAATLLAAGIAGFDTESKPTFAKNEVSGGPHVVQFATRDAAWLFQLHRPECNPVVAALIASTENAGIWTIQSGVFPENTASRELHRRAGFREIGVRERVGRHHGVWRDVVMIERRSSRVGS